MLKKISDTLYPPDGSSSKNFIRAGVINLLLACTVFALFGAYVFFSKDFRTDAPPPFGFVGIILWMVGIHYLFWRGSKSNVALVNVGKTIITATVGFILLLVFAGGIGSIAEIIVRSLS